MRNCKVPLLNSASSRTLPYSRHAYRDCSCSRSYRWTQVAEIVGTRHAERKCSPKTLSRANVDHPVQSAPSAGSIPSTPMSTTAIGTAMKTNCSWKASPGTVAIGRPSAAKNYHIAPPPTSRTGQSTTSSVPPGGFSDNEAGRHTMLIRKPPSDTTSIRTRETSPRFSNTEQFMDDDFPLNETFWDEESTNDQILPDAFNALFHLDPDTATTATSTHPSADAPLQRHRHDSGSALSVTTNTSASPSNSTTYRPPTAEMYSLNMNPLATGMWPSDWVASPKQAQATPTRIDFSSSSSSSNNFVSTSGSNSTTATTASSRLEPFVNSNPYLNTTQCDDFLFTEIFPTSPTPDPLWPASSLAHDLTESSTTNAQLDLPNLDTIMPPIEHDPPPTPTSAPTPHPINTRKLSKARRPSQQDRTDPKHNDIEERLARKRRRLAKGASMGTTKGRTTLVLEDVEPETLKTVMDTLLQSKTRMSMTHGIDDGIAD